MKRSTPPRIAAWLLDHFGSDPQLDAIAGDLLEEYQSGRTRFWYWREVIVTMISGVWAGFRDHTLLVLRAFAMGWVLMYLTMWRVQPVEVSAITPYIVLYAPSLFEHHFVIGLLFAAPWCALTGWVVARFAYRCRVPAVVGFALSYLLFCSIANLIWMITVSNYGGNYPGFLWLSLFGLTLAILILFGGGLLSGEPKRSVPKHVHLT